MNRQIENPATCELRSVIRFLNVSYTNPVDIHRHICEVYGDSATSDSMVRRWVGLFNQGHTNVHDDERTGRPHSRLMMIRRVKSKTKLKKTGD